jgi:hypothetical protein
MLEASTKLALSLTGVFGRNGMGRSVQTYNCWIHKLIYYDDVTGKWKGVVPQLKWNSQACVLEKENFTTPSHHHVPYNLTNNVACLCEIIRLALQGFISIEINPVVN